jgi:hypothetical protein
MPGGPQGKKKTGVATGNAVENHNAGIVAAHWP